MKSFTLCSLFVAVALSLSISSTATAAQECGLRLGAPYKPMSYVKIEALGFIPRLQLHENQPHQNGLSKTISILDPAGKQIGKIQYHLMDQGQKLMIDYIETLPQFRNNGLTYAMLAEILNENPKVKLIDMLLADTNAKAVDQSKLEGKSLQEAALASPAGKLVSRLGFSKIILIQDISFHESSYQFLVSQ